MTTKIRTLDNITLELHSALELIHEIREEGQVNNSFDASQVPAKAVMLLEKLGVVVIHSLDQVVVTGTVSKDHEIIYSSRIYNEVNAKKLTGFDDDLGMNESLSLV